MSADHTFAELTFNSPARSPPRRSSLSEHHPSACPLQRLPSDKENESAASPAFPAAMQPRFDSESSPLSQPSLDDMGWKARRSADSIKKLRAGERRLRASEQGADERLIALREGLDAVAEEKRAQKQARRDGVAPGSGWRAGQSAWADVDAAKEVDSWLVHEPMHAEPVTALASGAAACTPGAASSAAAALGLGVQLATAPAAPPLAKQAGNKTQRTDPCPNPEKCKRAALTKQLVIRPPLPLSGHPGTELPGLGRPHFKGEQWFSKEGVHFASEGGTNAHPKLTWKYAHQPSRHSEQKAKGQKGPGSGGKSRGGVTAEQRTLMATGPLVQQMTAHVAGASGSSSDAAPPAPPATPAIAPVAPGAFAAAAASSPADPAPIVSSVAEAADYAALTGRQIEAVELLLEHHKRGRAAGTAQGLLPLNVLPERAGGESKCDKRDRNNLVRLLRSIRDYRKVVVADTEFGKRSSRKLPRDVASILKAMGVSIAEVIFAKKSADRSSNSAWDVHDWRMRTAQSAEEHTGGVACWCVCRCLSKPCVSSPPLPCIQS